MVCPKCGAERTGGLYCGKCGYRFEDEVAQTNKNKRVKILLIIIIVIVVIMIFEFGLIFGIFSFVKKTLNNAATEETISYSSIDVPTIYKVTGTKYDVCGYNGGNKNLSSKHVEIEYCDIDSSVLDDYGNYLEENEDFTLTDPTNGIYVKTVDSCLVRVTIVNEV